MSEIAEIPRRLNNPILGPIDRFPVSHSLKPELRHKAAVALGDSQRLSNRERKYLKRAREGQYQFDTDVRISDPLRMLRKLSELPIAKVIRREQQFARRASSLAHQIGTMDDSSPFRAALETELRTQVAFLRQASAELKARELEAQGRLK